MNEKWIKCNRSGCQIYFESSGSLYCSKECEVKAINTIQHEVTWRVCLVCGRDFVPRNGAQKYCSGKCGLKITDYQIIKAGRENAKRIREELKNKKRNEYQQKLYEWEKIRDKHRKIREMVKKKPKKYKDYLEEAKQKTKEKHAIKQST